MSTYRDKIDTDRCHFCAKRRDIEGHHIVPQRFNGSDSRENLVGVCDRCHKKLEALYDKRFYEKLGIDDKKGERKNHFECQHDCSDAATVKMSGPYGASWLCTNHATRMMDHWDRFNIIEDLDGSATVRAGWVERLGNVRRLSALYGESPEPTN